MEWFFSSSIKSFVKEKEENLDAFDETIDTEILQRNFEFDDLVDQECKKSINFPENHPEGVIPNDTIKTYPKTIIFDYSEGVKDLLGRKKVEKVFVKLSK